MNIDRFASCYTILADHILRNMKFKFILNF